jgi:cytochrome c oxidase subunit III
MSLQQEVSHSKIHPHKFALWVAIASMIMMFGALTSAFIVRRAAGNWLEFQLPAIFFISTAVIALSSLTLQMSFNSYKKGLEKPYKNWLAVTFVLGLAFVVLQYMGWVALTEIGAGFTANPSSSFVWVISGLHAAHVLGGIGCLIVAMVHAFGLPFKVTKKRRTRFDLIVTYWHFVGILWLYLILFFILQS